jgi:hypothetical protein
MDREKKMVLLSFLFNSGLRRRGLEMEPSTRHDTAGLVVPAVLVAVGAAAAHPKCPKQPSNPILTYNFIIIQVIVNFFFTGLF